MTKAKAGTPGKQNHTPTPTRGVPVELGGKEYRLRYSLATLRQIREERGKEALQTLKDDAVGWLLQYGLRHADPDITVEQIEDWIDLENLEYVMQCVSKALGVKAKETKMVNNDPSLSAAGPTTEDLAAKT